MTAKIIDFVKAKNKVVQNKLEDLELLKKLGSDQLFESFKKKS